MKYFLYSILALVCYTTSAQHSLQGHIINAETQEPVAFANVYFPQLEKGTLSDETGQFSINNLPGGTHKLICSFLGFETVSLNITLPYTEELTITLLPSVVEMEEIILSTPFHQLQSENVMKVEHAKVADLKAGGALTLNEGLEQIAGVSAISTGQGIGKPVIRGLSANRVLVYTQGVRLENQQFGDEHGLGISDAGVESVEVIKGPASLLYGSDALGGVLYINPEKFAPENSQTATGSFDYFTNNHGVKTSLGYKSSGENFKFLFRGSTEAFSDYNTKDYRVTNSRFKSEDFKAGMAFQNTHFKTELRYNLNASRMGIPEEIGLQSLAKTPLLPYQNIHNHVLSSKSIVFFNNSSLDINLGLTYNDRKEFEEHHHDEHEEEEEEHEEEEHEEDPSEPALFMKLKTFNYDAKYHLPKTDKIETIVGLQGMVQENKNYGEELLIPDARINDIGALITSHIHFKTTDLQLGLRYDRRNITTAQLDKAFNSFNAAVGAKFNLFQSLALRANIASGFRAPNLAELSSDGSHEGTGRYEIGNANLTNEQNLQLDLALEYRNPHIEIFVNGFYNAVDNYIYLQPNGEVINNDPVFLYTQNNATLFGGEAGIHIHPHPLDWLHIESSFETVTGKQGSNPLPLIPANSLTNTFRTEFNTKWLNRGYTFVKLQSVFKQTRVSAFETPTEGYHLLSAGFGGSFSVNKMELAFTLSATNLLDKTYIAHLSRLKPEGIFNSGRNINLGMSIKL